MTPPPSRRTSPSGAGGSPLLSLGITILYGILVDIHPLCNGLKRSINDGQIDGSCYTVRMPVYGDLRSPIAVPGTI